MPANIIVNLTGGSGNTDPILSLGGVRSTTEVSASSMNNLFSNVQPAERVAGLTDYRAIDLYNSGDATATNVEVWMSVPTSSPDSVLHIGYDAVEGAHTTAWDGETIASSITAPSSPAITFAERTDGARLSLPDIPAAQAVRVWFKRIISPGAANTANDTGTFTRRYA